MAQSSGNPTGRTKMTRSEAARHAALVRYGKEHALGPATGGMSNPKIRARVAEILAANAAKREKKLKGPKGKAKAKGKGGTSAAAKQAKAKEAAAKKEARAKEQSAKKEERAKAKVAADMERTGKQAARAQAQKEKAAEREKKQAERAKQVASKQKAASAQRAKVKQAAEHAKAEKVKSKAAADKEKASAKEASDKEKAAAPAKRVADNRAKVAKDMADQDAGLAPGGAQALNDFADGKPLDKQAAQSFEDMGLTEKDESGNSRLTTEGRAAATAMSRGDTRATLDAISRAASKKKATTTEGKAMTDLAIKAGARHSSADMKHLQAIHDSSVACGASCGPGDDSAPMDDGTDEASKAVKAMYDDPTAYAAHECNDIVAAASALQSMAMILMSELGEDNDEEDTIPGLLKAAHLLVDYIDTELDSIEEADAAEDEDEGAGDTVGHEPMKAITAREDVNPRAGIAEYGKVDFADAKNHKYPIDTEAHVRSAWNYIAKEENAAKYDPDEVSQIKAKIVAAWKKLIDKAGPPAAGKSIDLIHVAGGAIKALDSDTIGGYAVLFGTDATPDIERDYYTKSTDFWLDHFGWPRPITYHHGMDAATKAAPVIGHWTKATIDDTGVWLEGQLDRAHAYYAAIKQLAERGYLKLSSDSAPQWVVRERQPNGANHVKRWPLVTASTTVTPMEPRMLPVEVKAFLAELGLNDIDDSQEAVNPDAALDAAKAADDERARRLLLELELLQLEWETASA